MLPIRTTVSDIDAVCGYLATKPTGATVAEAKAVLDSKVLDGRKLSALRFWGLIEGEDKMRLTERGREAVRDKGARKSSALLQVISSVAPYRALVERAVHRGEFTISATDAAAHLFEHFKSHASENDKILNDQAVCFFQIAQGADLGALIIGRRGQPTRFDFDEINARLFVEGGGFSSEASAGAEDDVGRADDSTGIADDMSEEGDQNEQEGLDGLSTPETGPSRGNRVFITHGKNKKILDQVKELVVYGKFEPVVAQERETSAKPVPDKVMDHMRSCQAAVIHVGVDKILLDQDGNEVPQINENVLIEIGAAMALYGRNFILLVEEGVQLPSNLQGLYECRYSGDELNMPATMKLLKAFNDFK